MLFIHLRLGLPSGLFPSGFPTNYLYTFLSPHSCHMSRPPLPPRLYNSNYTWRRVQIMLAIFLREQNQNFRFQLKLKWNLQRRGVCASPDTFLATQNTPHVI
jgi:hypothetical protein